ncbi:2-amino-3-carboxylmuconate-6-semialdehyde decarboxylase [Corallococcus coralloides DSM 2259]|uniref:2-amino-3-carboxymuconate-6-semialdehyde decarboxylase n=1 Tax=Corallococcus coralloides (strain ATCC 25202 / DSM 2259 / NBRC 100086 / M2) TaxID=1144275 RepID=H8MK36_CORCM|nr:amidohydrolase family protein [Corallococcus coralloides]AFE03753.1 2-amino-3-carboxylmuconate-6-semialdehyde decarboxylase [Corallococcus coralloides DSM 2259]
MKVDIHTHLLPPEFPRFAERFGYGGFITLDHHAPCRARMMRDDGKFFREIESNCWDPKQRVVECDAHGVQVQVLSTVPVLFSYWAKPQDGLEVARFLNDHLAGAVATAPKRFVGLGTVPLQSTDLAVKELERCVRTLGFAGVQIGSHVNDLNLSDPALFPFFQAASDLGAAVFVHPWDMMGEAKMTKYWLPWLVGMPAEVSLAICSLIFGGVMERLPKLRLAFAHGGGAFPGTLGRIQHGFEVRPDLVAVDNKVAPRDYLGRFWVDSLVHDAETLRSIVKLFGADKVALGSDYPFPLGEERPGTLIESLTDLAPSVRERLLSRNALEWLGRSHEDFAP